MNRSVTTNKPAISVIVPVYDVEAYLPRCIESILAQTFTDFELILVDDGSPDHCGVICDDYAAHDDRITVIHQQNSGLSAARNVGIEVAVGRYIGLVDSDDAIDPEMYQTLYGLCTTHGAEIAICGMNHVYKDHVKAGSSTGLVFTFSRSAGLQCLFEHTYFSVPVWDKLYQRDLFDGIRYPVGKYSEDGFTTYRLINKATTICYIDTPLYQYTIRDDSMTHGRFTCRYFDSLEATMQAYHDFTRTDSQLCPIILALYAEEAQVLMAELLVEPQLGVRLQAFSACRHLVLEQYPLLMNCTRVPDADRRALWHLKYDPVGYYLSAKYRNWLERLTPYNVLMALTRRLGIGE